MPAVVYGKHPSFGDFLSTGLPTEQVALLDSWLGRVLPTVRSALGDNWDTAWRSARPIRFWLGPAVLGAPLCGLMAMSEDKVGRRYPMLFGLTGHYLPPPVNPAHDESVYDHLRNHVSMFKMPEGGPNGALSLLEGFAEPDTSQFAWPDETDATLWGQRSDGDLARLLADARLGEEHKAQLHRSHWWRPATADQSASADWMACHGLPDAAAFMWLLTGQSAPQNAAAEQPRAGAPDVS